MAGPRADKVAVVEEVRDHLEQADAAILTEYRGLKVGDLATLRRALREAGAEYKIYKNTLVRRATSDTRHAAMGSMLLGPTAIAFVESDVAAVAKVLRDFARTHPALVVKGSFVGSDLLDARTTAALADLPSRDVLLSQIAGALAAPMRQFAALLKALPQNFAYGLSAVIDQRIAGGEALPEAEHEAEVEAEIVEEAAAEAEVAEEAAPAEARIEADVVADVSEEAADGSAGAEASASEGAVSPTESADADQAAGEADAAAEADAEATEASDTSHESAE